MKNGHFILMSQWKIVNKYERKMLILKYIFAKFSDFSFFSMRNLKSEGDKHESQGVVQKRNNYLLQYLIFFIH